MISLLSGGNRKGMKGKMTQKTFWSLPPAAGMNLYLDSKLQANDQLPTPSTVAAYSIRRYRQVYLVNTR